MQVSPFTGRVGGFTSAVDVELFDGRLSNAFMSIEERQMSNMRGTL